MNLQWPDTPQRCRVCGCVDDDCRVCIIRTGGPCSWVEPELCSACAGTPKLPIIRLLQSNECGKKVDWDFTFTGTLEEVIATCERDFAALPQWNYKIKAADPDRGPVHYWLGWQEEIEERKEPA